MKPSTSSGETLSTRRQAAAAAAVVVLAAIVPYLPSLDDYFVRDDFGVVQLLSQKPASYFPKWFYSSWMDFIWGYMPDEIRPFPALSYQLTSLGGRGSPVFHHALNILLHAANGLLVMAMARTAASLTLPAATFAALVFVLLPVQTESVAWITGRVDSMPAFFYLASFLAYVKWRRDGSGMWYAGSLAIFFVALFTKQNTITMVATLGAYDLLVLRRPPMPLQALVAPYMSVRRLDWGYLWLRYLLFGQVAREGSLNAQALHDFGVIFARHVAHVVVGDLDGSRALAAIAVRRGQRRLVCRRPARSAEVLLLRAVVVGDWHRAGARRRVFVAASRVSGGGRLGDRAGDHARRCSRDRACAPNAPGDRDDVGRRACVVRRRAACDRSASGA